MLNKRVSGDFSLFDLAIILVEWKRQSLIKLDCDRSAAAVYMYTSWNWKIYISARLSAQKLNYYYKQISTKPVIISFWKNHLTMNFRSCKKGLKKTKIRNKVGSKFKILWQCSMYSLHWMIFSNEYIACVNFVCKAIKFFPNKAEIDNTRYYGREML